MFSFCFKIVIFLHTFSINFRVSPSKLEFLQLPRAPAPVTGDGCKFTISTSTISTCSFKWTQCKSIGSLSPGGWSMFLVNFDLVNFGDDFLHIILGDDFHFLGNRACQTWVQILQVQARQIFFATARRYVLLYVSAHVFFWCSGLVFGKYACITCVHAFMCVLYVI